MGPLASASVPHKMRQKAAMGSTASEAREGEAADLLSSGVAPAPPCGVPSTDASSSESCIPQCSCAPAALDRFWYSGRAFGWSRYFRTVLRSQPVSLLWLVCSSLGVLVLSVLARLAP